MKIISIDLAETWGIKDPETGEEYEWETDEECPALFSSSLVTAVFPHEFPEDTTFTNDEEFTDKWVAFYEENQIRIDEDGDECQSALKSIHLTASNNVQQLNKVIPFSAPFYAA